MQPHGQSSVGLCRKHQSMSSVSSAYNSDANLRCRTAPAGVESSSCMTYTCKRPTRVRVYINIQNIQKIKSIQNIQNILNMNYGI